jgi:hypothetical protein
MSKVFLSWYDGQNYNLANEFLELLKKHSFDVELSPFSPQSGLHDERWGRWYADGLPNAIHQVEIFIAVITPTCDGSTWMLQEFQEACSSFITTGTPKLYVIRFDSLEKPVKFPEYYLQNSVHLSSTPEDAVRTLLTSSPYIQL